MAIRALVVDDEPLARDELTYLLSALDGIEVIGEASDAQSTLAAVREKQPDVVFMDIELQGENGLQVARQFLRLPNPPKVVFATAYDQYAVKAFELKALDYIVKPFTLERVSETVQRLRTLEPAPELDSPVHPELPRRAERSSAGEKSGMRVDRIPVEEEERIILLDPEQILFAAREERTTLIKVEGRTYRTAQSLQELEERLAPFDFFRTHRAYLVNLARILEIHPWFNGTYELVMADKERSRIPVSRQAARRLRQLLHF